METIQRLENPVNKYQPSLEKLDAYLDLFDRLGLVLDEADEVDREGWDEPWCKAIISKLKHEFTRVKLPERKTIWQALFVEQCLQPLWNQITFEDLLTVEHELSRDAVFRKRVVHIGYLIRFWQYSLRCQSIVLQEAELLSRSNVK